VDLIGRYYDRDTDGSLFGGGSEVKTTDLVVQLNWTLFQGGYVWSRTKEARELMKAAQEQLEREVRAARRQARFGYLGVEGALSRAEALEEAVVSQGLALEAKQLGFKSGLYTSLVVLDAERDLYYAKRELAKARYDYILNSVRLKQAAGSLSESDLAAINEWFQ
jgi:outer membrane protein